MRGALARCLGVVAVIVTIASAARADSLNHLIVTEDPGGLTYSLMLQGVDYGTTFAPGQNPSGTTTWFSALYYPILYPETVSESGFGNGTGFVNWLEPDGDGYNTINIAPNANIGALAFVFQSDSPVPSFSVPNGVPMGCRDASNTQTIACPVLPDGESYEVPLIRDAPVVGFANAGTLTVSFTDYGDKAAPADVAPVATPEPGTMTLVASGILLGVRKARSLRRRRA